MALRQVKDTPTNNFATLNSLVPGNGNIAFDDGNLNLHSINGGDYGYSWWPSILLPTKTSQTFYFEITGKNPSTTSANLNVGLVPTSEVGTTSTVLSGANRFYGENFWGRFSSENVTAFLFDFINFKVTLFSDNVEITGSSASRSFDSSISNHDYAALCFQTGGGGQTNFVLNFGQNPDFSGQKTDSAGPYADANGQGSFYYQPPAGALALCSRNIQSVEQDGSYVQNYVSAKGSFRAVTYTGNGGTQDVITGFQPDLVWVKSRNADLAGLMYDSVRGATKYLQVDSNNPQGTGSDSLTDFLDSGFSAGADTSTTGVNRDSSTTYIAWTWKAGGEPTSNDPAAEGSAMVDGTPTKINDIKGSATITPSKMSVNTKAGFSIVKYTAGEWNSSDHFTNENGHKVHTVPHGLTTADFVIVKGLTNPGDGSTMQWDVYHRSAGGSTYPKLMVLNSTHHGWLPTNVWMGDPTDVISMGDAAAISYTGLEFIAYCWHSVPGYSAFGSYTGNGDPNGPFVYTGFRPAWVMIKRTNSGADWLIGDTTREPFNGGKNTYNWFAANLPNKEFDYTAIDHLSNGFKLLDTHVGLNGSGSTYTYMAFAEQPGAFSNAR